MAASLDDNQERRIEDAVSQFVEMRARGEAPEVHEFVKRYPGLEGEISESIRAVAKIDSLFDSVIQADASDFEGTCGEGDLVGQRMGNFEIAEMIGRGGMGVVYLARDTKLDRSVAIKSMPAKLASDPTARARFRREARLLASLNHPNIAVIHDIIEQDEGAGYLVLEYVAGETLAERVAREPLTLSQALCIGRQIAEAVSAAHKKGVVHRDLKPGNIKITPDDGVKVLDFGLAKAPVQADKTDEITATEPGRIVGTPAYMSPEQARGKDTDNRTDIWSFGCVMFQMVTGRLPFEGETATDTLAKIIEREPDWELLPQRTPTRIRHLLYRCLEKDPDRRLADIADAATEIGEVLSGGAPAAPVSVKSRTIAMAAVVTLLAVLSVVVIRLASDKPVPPSSEQIRLVVLPFENVGPPNDEYFADGITDAITARLAGIHGLGVISRQSATQYKSREKNTQQIAQDLRVDYILEGTVQRERPADPNSNVRIRPQLIRASDDTHVWAQTYDNQMREVFQVQSDVAERVAQALDITLLEADREALRSNPIENIEAYDYYLQGNKYFRRAALPIDLAKVIRMHEKAIELDPNLALAYAQLSRAHLMMYWQHWDRSDERLIKAEWAVMKASELDPELPEVHLALGQYYYHGELNYARALQELQIAIQGRPSDGDIHFLIGCIHRRQGKFEQAVATLKQACELDPLYGVFASNLAETLVLMRRYVEAERGFDRFVSSTPGRRTPYHFKAWLRVCAEGDTATAREILAEAFENGEVPHEDNIANLLAEIDVFDGNYEEALGRRIAAQGQAWNTQHQYIPKALQCALVCVHMKDEEAASRYFDDARVILETRVEERWEDARFHSALGIAYAGLGRKQEAIRQGEVAVDLLPVSKDAMRGPYRLMDLAQIYTMVGDCDRAVTWLEYLLSIPSRLSKALLRIDPTWDPLRDHPRFKKLVEADE
jgi:serine/threonine protein kinase/tetratricopeptide (TPR) repeat protein